MTDAATSAANRIWEDDVPLIIHGPLTASGRILIPRSTHIAHLVFDMDGNLIQRHVRRIRRVDPQDESATMSTRDSTPAEGDDQSGE